MQTGKAYSEYMAWLQPGHLPLIPDLCVAVTPDVAQAAVDECLGGLRRLYDTGGDSGWPRVVRLSSPKPDKRLAAEGFIVLLSHDRHLPKEAYRLESGDYGFTITGADDNGLLYGIFAYLALIGSGQPLDGLRETRAPAVSARVLNHWDNIDGSVERGYAGRSLFFKDGTLSFDPGRIRDYARLLASVGINQLAFNNVNVTPQSARLITDELLPRVKELSDIFRPYGVRLILTVDYESPQLLGGLPTSDPLDPGVVRWWRDQTDKVYRYVPDLAGYLVKADSEFRNGPAALGRTQADGANVLARALGPHGGVIYWRCFVYDCNQDWRDTATDRPKAAYQHFKPLDGSFDSNVVLQIKHGPTDFQVREPNSPLLGAMPQTRQGLELQITQEYTGQQIDLYALPVQWEEILSAPLDQEHSTRSIIGRDVVAVCAVSNAGDSPNWTGHTLAQLNLFGFGRMAWNPELTARTVVSEWVRLTFGTQPELLDKLTSMLLESRSVYEKYNAPLGIGWMVNVNHHYGPSVDGYEYMKWGTYHRADHTAIGVDRTRNGTGFTGQYRPWLAKLYDDPAACPEELLLFFHRIPYNHVLKSGKSLIQHIYDTHFEGVRDVERFIRTWDSMEALLPEQAYRSVRDRLWRQLANAREWRDVVNSYFFRKTGIPDSQGRKIYT